MGQATLNATIVQTWQDPETGDWVVWLDTGDDVWRGTIELTTTQGQALNPTQGAAITIALSV